MTEATRRAVLLTRDEAAHLHDALVTAAWYDNDGCDRIDPDDAQAYYKLAKSLERMFDINHTEDTGWPRECFPGGVRPNAD